VIKIEDPKRSTLARIVHALERAGAGSPPTACESAKPLEPRRLHRTRGPDMNYVHSDIELDRKVLAYQRRKPHVDELDPMQDRPAARSPCPRGETGRRMAHPRSLEAHPR
jgi:hypothetical protein